MFTKPKRKVNRVFIHCSASDHASHDNIATMRKWHTDPEPKGRGWADVGYHFFIRKSGQLENGRGLEKTPAAQYGHNKNTIAISLHGLKKANFTELQFITLKKLCTEINSAYAGAVTFHGHSEVANKACPVFDYKSVLKLNKFGGLGLTGAAPVSVKKYTVIDDKKLPDLEEGDVGPAVELLQELLLIKVDGIFGSGTAKSVRTFKRDRDLYASDKVKSYVWRLLLDNDHIPHFER